MAAGIGRSSPPGPTVIARGVADNQPAACEQASEAARKAKLID
jgi:hypothetical protein